MGAGSQQTGSTPQSGSSLPPLLAQKSVATLLRTYLETGVSHNQQRLHKVKYFQELLATNPDVPDSLRPLLKLSRETIVRRQLVTTRSDIGRTGQDLRTVPDVEPITALTWALEIGGVSRIGSIKQAISY